MNDTQPDTFIEFPRASLRRSIVARFEEQASRHAERVAVRHGDGVLTYTELNVLSNRVARAIRNRLGDMPGPVALLAEGELLAPAAAIGVLKSGGIYVPLEPSHPEQRNASILGDSGARLVLTTRHHKSRADALTAVVGSRVATLAVEDIHDLPVGDPGWSVPSDAPCSLIYTSGSMGRPKGVCQVHRTMLHGTMVYTNSARLTCHDRFSLIHGINTQHGMTALFAALLNGAAILPFNIQRQGLDALAPWLLNYRISVLHPLPSLFRRFGQRLAPDVQFDDVRVIRLTGEPVTRTEWELFQTHFRPGCVLHVGLGSTEALHYRQRLYSWEDNPPDSVLPVGDAIPDKDVMLVDELGKPVATGEVGEIVIRSEFLFAAYWRRPALTAEVMSPDPRGLRKRVFRTGDLGRLTPDGRFFHVGRRDQQVKVVGNRIEVAEIEYALRCIDGIRDAAVVPQRRGPNESRLVAFTVVNGDPPTSLEVREGLAMRLPSHMIPSLFVIVNDLPLLPGGKVDRGALEERAASTRNAPVLARNEAEDTLVAIWQRALVTEDVGIHDDFFLDLGGDSLAAVQMLAEVREVFGRNMPLSVLHEATTVATFAPYLFDTEWVPPNNGQLAVNQDGAQLPLFGVCGAFGHALRLLLVGRALGDDQPLYGLQPPAMDWLAAGCRTIEAMAAHYVRKIRIIQPRGPYCLFGTSFGGVMAFEIAIQLQRVGEVVALLAMIDTMPPNCTSIDGIDFAERHDWAAGITVTDPLVAAGVRVARAHRVALDAHMLRDVFDGAIVYFKCLEPPVAPVADRRLRWEYFATGGIQVVPIPGRHGTFHREPQFAAVTKGLRVALNTSLAETLHHGGDTTG